MLTAINEMMFLKSLLRTETKKKEKETMLNELQKLW